MSNRKQKTDEQAGRQLSLFDILVEDRKGGEKPQAGSLSIDIEFRELISASLKQCPNSRYYVAGRMSELTGAEITKARLDSWTAESKEFHRFPAIFLPAFCISIGNTDPVDFLARKSGVYTLPGKGALRAEVQKLKEEKKRINKKIKAGETRIEILKEAK